MPPAETPNLGTAVRLVDNSSSPLLSRGHVEVLSWGQWYPVCAERFGPRAAAVVCRQKGFVGGVATVEPEDSYGSIPDGASPAMLNSDWNCAPDTNSLHECGLYWPNWPEPWSCPLAAVTCSNSTGAW